MAPRESLWFRGLFQMLQEREKIAHFLGGEVFQQAFGHEGNFGTIDALDLVRMENHFRSAGQAQAERERVGAEFRPAG